MASKRIAKLEAERGKPIHEILISEYADRGSTVAVADALGVSQATVSTWLAKLGYEVKSTIVKKSA